MVIVVIDYLKVELIEERRVYLMVRLYFIIQD